MQQRRGETAADDVAQHVEDDDVRLLEQVVLLQQLHRLADDIAAAAGAGGRAAGFDAEHAVIAFDHEILGPQLLGVEADAVQHVDHRRDHPAGQREGAVVLRIAADLQHPLAELAEGNREVRAGRALADAALAVDGEDGRALDLRGAIGMHLHASIAIAQPGQAGIRRRSHDHGHAAISTFNPSSRSSSSSPARRSASMVSSVGCQ